MRSGGTERNIPGQREQVRHMNGGYDMHPGRRTHPGTDTGPVHAGTVMCRMLEFVRDRAAGRHRQ